MATRKQTAASRSKSRASSTTAPKPNPHPIHQHRLTIFLILSMGLITLALNSGDTATMIFVGCVMIVLWTAYWL